MTDRRTDGRMEALTISVSLFLKKKSVGIKIITFILETSSEKKNPDYCSFNTGSAGQGLII